MEGGMLNGEHTIPQFGYSPGFDPDAI